MNNSDQLLHELETHVQRIIENRKPESPDTQDLNVTGQRAGLVNALTRFIDQRIEERLRKYADDQKRRP